MANVNALRTCPRCGVELPPKALPACPNVQCRHILAAPQNLHFKDPDYVSRQLATQKRSFARRSGRERPKDELEEESLLLSDYCLWGRQAPMQSRIMALRDAFHLIRYVLHADMSEESFREELQELTGIGKEIGKLSETVENYFRYGGSSSDDRYKRQLAQENSMRAAALKIP